MTWAQELFEERLQLVDGMMEVPMRPGFGFTWDCDAQLYRRRAIWHAAQFGDAAFHRKKLARLLF